MEIKIGRSYLVVLFILSMLLLGCSSTTLSQPASTAVPIDTKLPMVSLTPMVFSSATAVPTETPTSTATVTLTPLLTATLIRPSAQELALTIQDLGTGWFLDAEVNDQDASYYVNRGEDGQAIIGTHRNSNKPMFDPAIIDSVSMRGYSQPDQRLMLFIVVTVFKEMMQTEEAYREFQQAYCEPPCEYLHQYDDGSGERYIHQNALIADEAIRTSIWFLPDWEEDLPFGTALKFREGQVLVYLLSVGQWDNLANAPPIAQAHLEELAKMIEVQIP